MEQASTVRRWLLITIDIDQADIDHADEASIVMLQPGFKSISFFFYYYYYIIIRLELKKLWLWYFKNKSIYKGGGGAFETITATPVCHHHPQHWRNFKDCTNPIW